MAIQLKPNTVYKCAATPVASAVIHVVSGSINLLGSNVTKHDRVTKVLIRPKLDDLVPTGDEMLSEGIHLIAGLPEWIAFKEDAEVWARMVTEVATYIDAEDVKED